jgi:hypothetical protein
LFVAADVRTSEARQASLENDDRKDEEEDDGNTYAQVNEIESEGGT